MKVQRKELVQKIEALGMGLAPKPTIEQSDLVVFINGEMIAFNDEILVRMKGLPDRTIKAAVAGGTLLKVLKSIKDEEIDLAFSLSQLKIRGKRKEAGLVSSSDVSLPFDHVPKPPKKGKFDLTSEHLVHFQQAVLACTDNEAEPATMCVHAAPGIIEGCDGHRLYRAEVATGLSSGVCIPASALDQLLRLQPVTVACDKGWAHFEVPDGKGVVSIRLMELNYPDTSTIPKFTGEVVTLPKDMDDMLKRASSILEASHSQRVTVSINDEWLQVISETEDIGYYKEKRRLKQVSKPMKFIVHPDFLTSALTMSRKAIIDKSKLKMERGTAVYVVALFANT